MTRSAEGLDWICKRCGFRPRTRRALRLVWLEGHTLQAAAAAMAVREFSLRKLLARAKRRIAVTRALAPADEQDLWEISEAGETQDEREAAPQGYAASVLDAQRNVRRHDPATPQLDDNGRMSMGRSPLVDAETAARAFEERRREKLILHSARARS